LWRKLVAPSTILPVDDKKATTRRTIESFPFCVCYHTGREQQCETCERSAASVGEKMGHMSRHMQHPSTWNLERGTLRTPLVVQNHAIYAGVAVLLATELGRHTCLNAAVEESIAVVV
jgi:hypothetical protein